MVAALTLLVLTADVGGHPLHGGVGLGLGLGAPLRAANAGFQLGAELFLEVGVLDKLAVGASVPFSVGFFSMNGSGSIASGQYTAVDVMPGLRAAFAVLDWVSAALDLGLGPHVLVSRVDVDFGGFHSSQSETRTFFGLRVALEVLAAPPSLSGVFFGARPVEVLGRVGDRAFSEYRFSVLVGYRR